MAKKLISLVLVMAMCLSLCATSFAVNIEAKNIQEVQETLNDLGFNIPEERIFSMESATLSNVGFGEYAFVENDGTITVSRDLDGGNAELFSIVEGTIKTHVFIDRQTGKAVRDDYDTCTTTIDSFPTETAIKSSRTSGIEPMATNAGYTYLGKIRYQYAAGSEYKLCAASINLNSVMDNSDQYDLYGTYKDKLGIVSYILGVIAVPAGVANVIAGCVIGVASVLAGGAGYAVPHHYIQCSRMTNTWKVIDTSNSNNYDVITGSSYTITETGYERRTFFDDDFYAQSAYGSKNTNFAYYVYSLLFSYNIFSIYDWTA